MNKIVLIIISLVAFSASATMYYIGSDSSHLSELKDYYYIPLPIGLLALLGLFTKSKS